MKSTRTDGPTRAVFSPWTNSGALGGAPKSAVIYLRVSTQGQVGTWVNDDGLSLSAQEDICRQQAAQLGAIVSGVYKEKGVTATKRDRRDALASLLRDIERQPVDYVIVYRLDRLARNTVDDVNLTREIEALGARLVSVMEQFDDSSPQGWLMHRMFAMLAEFEVKQSGQRVAMGMQKKAELGGTPNKPPIGYLGIREQNPMVSGGRGIARVVIDPERAPHVKWAFERYAEDDWSISRLVDELDEIGLRSKPHRRNALPRPLKKSEVGKMLRNRYYLGRVIYKGMEYDGEHEPLVEPDLFAKVQDLLTSRNQSGSRYRVHNHYLKGSVVCARCRGRFYEMNVTNRHGSTYPYFVCRGRQQRSCTMRYLRCEQVEDKVHELYRRPWLPEAKVQALREFLDAELDKLDAENEQARQAQEVRLERLMEEEKKNAAAYRADAISLDVLKDERERIDKERADARRIIANASVHYSEIRHLIDTAIQLAADWTDTYRRSPDQTRRTLNQIFFDAITVDTEEATGQLSEPYQRMADVADVLTSDSTPRWLEELEPPDPENEQNPGTPLGAQGSSKNLLVREGGLEL